MKRLAAGRSEGLSADTGGSGTSRSPALPPATAFIAALFVAALAAAAEPVSNMKSCMFSCLRSYPPVSREWITLTHIAPNGAPLPQATVIPQPIRREQEGWKWDSFLRCRAECERHGGDAR